MTLENIFLENNENFSDWLINVRREIHKHPELDFELPETVKTISKYLDELNIPYKTGIGKSGIVAELSGKNKNITIALRADIDALPIIEKTNCEYKSQNYGKMHACGHDGHTAVLLGAAKIFSEKREFLPCNVRFLFQPAEETSGGAVPMIEDGCLENVDAVFGLHVDASIDAGKIGVKYGAMNASSTELRMKIKGKSSHGAYPSTGIDAIVIAAQVISSIQSIVSRNVDSRDSVVISFGTIAGGEKENIIAQEVSCIGTMRTVSNYTREAMKKRLKTMVEMVSGAYGGEGEIKFTDGYTALINHEEYVDIIKENGKKLLGDNNVVVKNITDMGVEDFAYYIEKVPGAFYTLGIRNKEKGINSPLHSDTFNIDESALLIGAEMQILNVLSAYEKLNS